MDAALAILVIATLLASVVPVMAQDSRLKQATVMEYFEIFLSRMVMCRRSADILGYKFALNINGTYLE